MDKLNKTTSIRSQTIWGKIPQVCGRRCKHIINKEPWIKCTCK